MAAASFYMCTNGVAVVLPQIRADFFQSSLTAVQMMTMFPGIMTAVSFSMQGQLLRHFSKKWLLITGLVLVGAAALGALLFHSQLWLLFLWNGLMGVGSGGLAAPVAALVLRDVSTGENYAARMGLWNASLSLGGVVLGLCGGLAARYLSWPWAWAANLLALPAAALCALWLPAAPPCPTAAPTTSKVPGGAATKPLLFAFAFALLYFTVLPNLPLLIAESHFERFDAALLSGACIAALMLGGLAMGVAYRRLPPPARRGGTTLGCLLLGSACLLLAFCKQNTVLLFAGAFLAGAANSLVVPTLSQMAAAQGARFITLASTTCPALASFLSPSVFGALMKAGGFEDTAHRFALAGVCSLLLAVPAWYGRAKK